MSVHGGVPAPGGSGPGGVPAPGGVPTQGAYSGRGPAPGGGSSPGGCLLHGGYGDPPGGYCCGHPTRMHSCFSKVSGFHNSNIEQVAITQLYLFLKLFYAQQNPSMYFGKQWIFLRKIGFF